MMNEENDVYDDVKMFEDNFPSNISQINQKNEDVKKDEKKEDKNFLNTKNRKPKKRKKSDKNINQNVSRDAEENKMDKNDDTFLYFKNYLGNSEDGDKSDLINDMINVNVGGASSSLKTNQTSENNLPERNNGYKRMSVTEKTNDKSRL